MSRWLHIYGSLFGLALLLFFSLTGLTLNHADWTFGARRRERLIEGVVPIGWVGKAVAEVDVRKFEVVETLRRTRAVHGLVEEFRVEDGECLVSFKAPGYSADVFIDRRTGAFRGTEISEGFISFLNDLHKGRHAGRGWAWVIDLTALAMVGVSATGLVLLLYMRRKRLMGLVAVMAGVGLLMGLVGWLVP